MFSIDEIQMLEIYMNAFGADEQVLDFVSKRLEREGFEVVR